MVVVRVACALGASVASACAAGGGRGLSARRWQGGASGLACPPLLALAMLEATDARAGRCAGRWSWPVVGLGRASVVGRWSWPIHCPFSLSDTDLLCLPCPPPGQSAMKRAALNMSDTCPCGRAGSPTCRAHAEAASFPGMDSSDAHRNCASHGLPQASR